MGLAATHLVAYIIMGGHHYVSANSTGEPLSDELSKSDINWLTHQVS